MSMKFLSGLQDLLGLYDGGPGGASTSSVPMPPTHSPSVTPTMFQQQGSSTSTGGSSLQAQPKRTLTDVNSPAEDEEKKVRQCSHDKKVSFCDDVVTGYCDPFISRFISSPSPDQNTGAVPVVDSQEILEAYQKDCRKLRCPPSATVERQIGYLHRNGLVRQECLSLKGERVSAAQMEALEEVFKRVQFDALDFEYTFLDDDCAVILSEILEYYDSAVKLNLSFNKQIGIRGWTALCRAIRMADSLQMLNLRYTSLSDKALTSLCRSLRSFPSPALSCLHLENTNMSGKNLLVLCCSLKSNDTLKELYLGDNNLQPTDGAHIYQLIVSNTSILMLDLRNNSLGDSGLGHICDALRSADGKNGSLSALVLWNNKLTGASMFSLARALKENEKIETLNIGSNKIGLDGLQALRDALAINCHLHRLGLQSTNLSNEAVIVLAECLADCQSMVRVDIRDNPQIGSAGLLALHSAMKLNKSITLLNIDSSCISVVSEKVRPYQEQFQSYYEEISDFCERNKREALQRLKVKIRTEEDEADADRKEEKNEDDAQMNDADEAGTSSDDTDAVKDGKPRERSEKKRANSDESAPIRSRVKRNTISGGSPLDILLSPSSATGGSGQIDGRFTRSCSLTCDETVHDISERIQSMSASALSLDTASNSDSVSTIKKGSNTITNASSSLSKVEWTSLPSIPQAETPAPAPARKTRRFSVSPSSSTFDVTTRPASVSPVPASHSPSYTTAVKSYPLQPPRTLNLWGVNSVSPLSSPSIRVSKAETSEQIEDEVRNVVNDLVNFVAYESDGDSQQRSPVRVREITPLQIQAQQQRMGKITEENESDEEAVQSCVRAMIREVLQGEKEELKRAVESRRRKAATPLTPLTPSGIWPGLPPN